MCTSPLIRYRIKHRGGKGVILGSPSVFSIKSLKEFQSCFKNYSDFKNYMDEHYDYQYIKCRKCNECKAEYAQEWGIRCAHEFQMRKLGAFITLTVDSTKANLFMEEKNLKKYCKRCEKGNRYIKYPIDYTLCKGLILDELKRMRDNIFKRTGIKIRYFGCGEYGEEGERPHYHILIFGYSFPDKKFLKISEKGINVYYSEELQKMWKYGMTTVQEVNTRACMYTAKYCMKKLSYQNEQQKIENYYGREPEFLIMSRGNCNVKRCKYIDEIIKNCKGMKSLREMDNPYCSKCEMTRGGIGFDWFVKYYKDVLKIGYITLDGIKYKIPKYYLDILKLTDEEKYDKYKLNLLKKIEEIDDNERSIERLTVKAKVQKNKLKHYHRM